MQAVDLEQLPMLLCIGIDIIFLNSPQGGFSFEIDVIDVPAFAVIGEGIRPNRPAEATSQGLYMVRHDRSVVSKL